MKEAIAQVAADLGNTPTVCRASYVHPRVLETFPTGDAARGVGDHSAAEGPAHTRGTPHPRRCSSSRARRATCETTDKQRCDARADVSVASRTGHNIDTTREPTWRNS